MKTNTTFRLYELTTKLIQEKKVVRVLTSCDAIFDVSKDDQYIVKNVYQGLTSKHPKLLDVKKFIACFN